MIIGMHIRYEMTVSLPCGCYGIRTLTALGCGAIKCYHHWKCEDVNGGRRKKRVGKVVMVLFVCL